MTPQLRFPEFTDEWQVKKLGNVVKLRKKKFDPQKSSESRKDIELDNLASETGGVLGYVDSRTQMSIKNVFQKSDVLYGKLRPYLKKFAKAPWDGVSSSEIWAMYSDDINSNYLLQLVQTKAFNDSVNIQSGSKMPRADWGLVSDTEYNLPSKPEQEKIADFLTAVDERIAVGEKKLELLETYKRGVMQKIFSQQIRFKDENGSSYPDWDEKKLSDVLKERNTQTPISGEYPLMAFVAYKGVAPKGDRYNREFLVSDAKSKKYKQTQLGDFIYSSNNLETGSIGLNLYGSASISPVYSIFEAKDGYSHQFLGAYLTRKKFIYQMVRYRQGVVYGQWRIHESEFLKIEEKFPCTGEQQKIADFLTTLDDKITAEKSKLTAAREFKKALLQRMFV